MMRSKKLEIRLELISELIEDLRSLDIDGLNKVLRSWGNYTSQIEELLSSKPPRVTSSVLVTGIDQGLREFPDLIIDFKLNEAASIEAMKRFHSIVDKYIPGHFDSEKKKLSRIISVGRIRSEKEYYLVRFRMDEIERLDENSEEYEQLDALLLDFENSSNKQRQAGTATPPLL
jgi:hypothetical protein